MPAAEKRRLPNPGVLISGVFDIARWSFARVAFVSALWVVVNVGLIAAADLSGSGGRGARDRERAASERSRSVVRPDPPSASTSSAHRSCWRRPGSSRASTLIVPKSRPQSRVTEVQRARCGCNSARVAGVARQRAPSVWDASVGLCALTFYGRSSGSRGRDPAAARSRLRCPVPSMPYSDRFVPIRRRRQCVADREHPLKRRSADRQVRGGVPSSYGPAMTSVARSGSSRRRAAALASSRVTAPSRSGSRTS